MEQVSTNTTSGAAGEVSIGAAIGIAFGASAVTAVTILLLWWNSRRRAVSRATHGGVEFAMMNREDRGRSGATSPLPAPAPAPAPLASSLEELLDLDGTRATPASIRSTPPKSKYEPTLHSIGEASERSTTSPTPDQPAAVSPSNLYTPSLYRAAPPDSIQQRRLAPPNLTTEYSTASLGGYEEFAPWILSSEMAVQDGQEDGQTEL
ncbi:hypothetical protein BST61_g4601 [Cercospora zeina]